MKLSNSFFIALVLSVFSMQAREEVTIIPQPTSVAYGEGSFQLKGKISIISAENLENEASYLAKVLQTGFGQSPRIKSKGKGIGLFLEESLLSELGEEGYILSVGKKGITIKAATNTGVFYGIQSLRQMLPPDFGYAAPVEGVTLPILEISDTPRFPWRAFMLDESRHFKGSETVKKMLDQMALLKMNTFHWHLTDDQGWRIEIKKYPKLTEIGSKRKNTQVSRKSEERTKEPHEGFYTQEEIKEIIAYAKARHITVVPEIEMPGHAMAAIAAYHWLGTLGTTTEVPAVFGKMDDSFNIGDEKVVRFLKDVLDEVMALFPGSVVHIGGDEVNYTPWETHQDIVSFMKEKNLGSPADLQIYFTNEISNYIDNAGKRMMGWNEIMGDDIHGEREQETVQTEKLAKSAIVHFWKGDLQLINRAVQEGYDVVNSNHWDTYLDYTYQRLPLSKSYAFDPIPKGLDQKYHARILGSGTQMWSEWIPTVESMEKQIFPRLAAYAEVGWTQTHNKDFDRFQRALDDLKITWAKSGISFH
ncbi:beta-N-acetylhexosaminidase [Zobellia galactanivorans]|uniref:beta-N-acetylhexosaminidase n=1 Tax=Zobellia galactanivorans (strain DSM 12802 / CCUG 47099 / CIP 106680 / NCIMB 13871 / Dsij) TaxID=63186 RepID=G0L8E1_ZOBGA|nr:beta-N-acetylhexosaminidase [Zobellia galactanivorans]MBU3024732.1 beta-N-acetylhexosaminidase [Zobellia galactanivorans]MDO6810662.1 beta-N-acetylhexosaminidase [Zobellia galactanivorans]CAZ97490.1 Beta-N-acetylhexosaminidase, family GH20 [Zobellia galactanivorans]